MLRLNLKWYTLLIVSSLVLIWRLTDFFYEAASEGFHMTRGGLALYGAYAEAFELAIILSSAVLLWKAVSGLVRSQLTDAPEWHD